MRYFCDVHIQSGKDEEAKIFVVINDEDISANDTPKLTKEILCSNNQYKAFIAKYRPKRVLADYVVYSSEDKQFSAASQDEHFEMLIKTEKATRVAQSELDIDCTKKQQSAGTGNANISKKKKKKASPAMKFALYGGIVFAVLIAFGLGNKLGKGSAQPTNGGVLENNLTSGEDGMLIPEQEYVNPDSEQITVSIDRSYSAVPKEDLQLKGAVIEGVAVITLPEFDKTDFFTHVPGHSWGFTTDPNGKKIEYYGGRAYNFTKDVKLYRVLVKYGGGNGTQDDPYLIDYYDQLALMAQEADGSAQPKARGYFRQTADLRFPDWDIHQPINTVNELKADPKSEYFEYDGGGFAIKGITNPLFGKVSGAVIKNVNIMNSFINTTVYKDYGFIVCEAYNYRYKAEDGKTYETGETLIQNCSVSHSAIYAEYPKTDEQGAPEIVTASPVVPPDVVEYDEDGNIITEPKEPVEPPKHGEFAVGIITGLGGQIENCYVTDCGIFAELDDYFLYAGGISGKPANIVNSGVFYFSAQGKIFNMGGIAGCAGGARMYDPMGRELPDFYGGNIQGCFARNIIAVTEVSAGGIVGEGGTNAENALISNCYANELDFSVGVFEDAQRTKPKKLGFTGGIIGADGKESNGHLVTNTVSVTGFSVIGSKSNSVYDDTVRLAPPHAFYQQNILTVINRNTVTPNKPGEIYTGSFMFAEDERFSGEGGNLPYPAEISGLFSKVWNGEE